jgi:hypothetical protein
LVPEPGQHPLFEFNRSDRDFLREAGIKPCVIRCLGPRPPAVALAKEHPPRITENDIEWLRECGVAWERKPAAQLSLDFSGCQEAVQET